MLSGLLGRYSGLIQEEKYIHYKNPHKNPHQLRVKVLQEKIQEKVHVSFSYLTFVLYQAPVLLKIYSANAISLRGVMECRPNIPGDGHDDVVMPHHFDR